MTIILHCWSALPCKRSFTA